MSDGQRRSSVVRQWIGGKEGRKEGGKEGRKGLILDRPTDCPTADPIFSRRRSMTSSLFIDLFRLAGEGREGLLLAASFSGTHSFRGGRGREGGRADETNRKLELLKRREPARQTDATATAAAAMVIDISIFNWLNTLNSAVPRRGRRCRPQDH